ncbi:MAG: DUF4421 domain-containing protein [Vicingaceae bacterium]
MFIALSALRMNAQAVEPEKVKSKSEVDTNYVVPLRQYITTRFYLSRKYTNMVLDDSENGLILDYEPNTTLNFGVGATANGFTLNLAYGFKFLNEDVGKGKTRYLDLQSNTYTRKYVIDFFAQFYNGLYLDNTQVLNPDSITPYYLRPDFRIRIFGISFQEVLNERKFSYAAPLVQNEYQKKSAGSFLIGGELTYLYASADSNFIPHFVNDSLFQEVQGIDRLNTFQFGPSGGYAYSLVIRKHFFIMLTINLSLLISSTSFELEGGTNFQEWQLNPNLSTRAAIGYNAKTWYLGTQWVQNNTTVQSVDETVVSSFGIGNFRLNYVKRFLMGPKLKKQINRIPF